MAQGHQKVINIVEKRSKGRSETSQAAIIDTIINNYATGNQNICRGDQ